MIGQPMKDQLVRPFLRNFFLPDLTPLVAYFAQYGNTSGSLRISSESISFRPLIPTKKVKPPVTDLDIHQSDFTTQSESIEEMSTTPKPKPKTVDIAMSDVVGIKKRDKTSFLVVVAAGLEIECVDGTVSAECMNRIHS